MDELWLKVIDYCKFRRMEQIESLEEFYKRKFDWLPEDLNKDIGHFNFFRIDTKSEERQKSVPYRRRDFYKIMLVKGPARVHYADRVIEVKKQVLSFSNPLIPYKWEHLEKMTECTYMIFNQQFFHQYAQFQHYELFQPNGAHIFELTDEQAVQVRKMLNKIETEFLSGYKYKFDSIRTQIMAMIHYGLKLEPGNVLDQQPINASHRISMLFMELLERQFPIDDRYQSMRLRSASEFAERLNVHVNHLNRAVKEATEKTTSQLIAERIVQESKVLLRHSTMNVSEIAYALGFNEVTHFNNFFKKHLDLSPLKFRNDLSL